MLDWEMNLGPELEEGDRQETQDWLPSEEFLQEPS